LTDHLSRWITENLSVAKFTDSIVPRSLIVTIPLDGSIENCAQAIFALSQRLGFAPRFGYVEARAN
jgi:hypothetical protein